jgi:hypothetical protein
LFGRSLLAQVGLPTVQLLMEADDRKQGVAASDSSESRLELRVKAAVAKLQNPQVVGVEKVHGNTS